MQSLHKRLVTRILPLVIIPLLVLCLFSAWIISRNLQQNFQRQLERSLSGAKSEIDHLELDLLLSSLQISTTPLLIEAVKQQDRQQVLTILARTLNELGLDIAEVTDSAGVVLAEGHRPTRYGHSEANRDSFRALDQRESLSGIEKTDLGLGIFAKIVIKHQQQAIGVLTLSRLIDYAFLVNLEKKYGLKAIVYTEERLQATTFRDPEVLTDKSLTRLLTRSLSSRANISADIDLAGEPFVAISESIKEGETSVGALVLALSAQDIAQAHRQFFTLFMVGGSGLVILTLFAIWQFTKGIVAPIRQLSFATEKVAAGDFEQEVVVHSQDEIGSLAGSFNDMSGKIKALIGQLESQQNSLEQMVHQRTQELQRSNQSLRTTLDSIGDAVIATDADGVVVMINPVAEKLTGWSRREALGRPLPDVFHIVKGQNRALAENPVRRVLATGETVALANDRILLARDGKEYQVADSAAPIRSGPERQDVVGVVLVFRDVTEEYAVQKKLNQRNKMDAIGQLAGGVAHDFNNMLGGIATATELLTRKVGGTDQRVDHYLEIIKQATSRAANLTTRLLTFSRKRELSVTGLSLHEVIDEAVAILSQTIDKSIQIIVNKNAPNDCLEGDSSDLQNAIMNLAINGSHAMPGGGELTLETINRRLDDAYCGNSLFNLEPGEFIQFTVRDTGSGIAPENLEKIFEPFFTTKEPGKGTGLGLASVYGTVINHRGAISVESEVGQGSVFRIYLPCSNRSVRVEKSNRELLSGSGRILLVDDEELIRSSGKYLLEELGYEILLASNGAEALKIFKDQHERIDLVITDMIMPKMSGRELFLQMKEIDQDCKIVISSGYTKENIDDLQQLGLTGFVGKPFSGLELSQLISSVLNP